MFGSKVVGVSFFSLALVASAFAANRVGPVSQYGQLQAGKNSSGKGQIYGSCKGTTSGNEVSVQGSSLFWSGADEGSRYWTSDIVNGMVSKHNIEVIRAPMSVDETGWSGSDHYFKSTSTHQNLMNTVVQSAIDNDIYVIIDFHSHCAENSTENAKTFFSYMAQKWGKYDNVIFEIYNEPKGSGCSESWIELPAAQSYWQNTIKPYAESVISEIRKYSDNLIVVGTPYYDQYTNAALSSPLTDSNVAYTFHYYAGSDTFRHTTSNQGNNAVLAMNGGLSVFVTEWGNSNPQGGVDNNGNSLNGSDVNATYSQEWYNWMVTNKLSGANWSITDKDESASYFTTSGAWNYTTSGIWTNENVYAKNPTSYTACSGTAVVSSSSVASSSSVQSSSSVTVTDANLIDDFEDGDNVAYTGLSDKWFAFNDSGDKGASTFSNASVDGEYVLVMTADNGSDYMAGLKNISLSQGGYKYSPYVNLGLSIENGLPGCKTITYKFKGAGHNLKAILSGDESGALSEYNYHKFAVTGSTSWTTAVVSVDSLKQESGWGTTVSFDVSKVANMQWEVKGTASSDYLYVDDLACDGMNITRPVAESSSSEEISSSSEEVSSSSAVSSSSVESSSSEQTVKPGSSSEEIIESSSSSVKYEIAGSTEQTVIIGDEIETVTISGVTSYSRNSWTINFLDIPQQAINGQVVISGTVQSWATAGSYTDTLTVNGETVPFKLTLVVQSSSSSEIAESSSSAVPSVVEESSSSEQTVKPESSSSEIAESSSSVVPSVVEESSSSEQAVEPGSSSSSAESPSTEESSSSVEESSSSVEAIAAGFNAPMFIVAVSGRSVTISGVTAGSKLAVFDLNGNLISAGRVDTANLNITLPRSGAFIVRVNNQVKKINVR